MCVAAVQQELLYWGVEELCMESCCYHRWVGGSSVEDCEGCGCVGEEALCVCVRVCTGLWVCGEGGFCIRVYECEKGFLCEGKSACESVCICMEEKKI